MMNKKAKIISSLLLGIFTITGIMFAASQKVVADKKEEPQKPEKVEMMCYFAGPPALRAPEYPDLIKEQNDIETLYREGKINKETYEVRKSKIEEEIRLLNEEYEQKNKKQTEKE